jgi:hypothetical protein
MPIVRDDLLHGCVQYRSIGMEVVSMRKSQGLGVGCYEMVLCMLAAVFMMGVAFDYVAHKR